LICLDTSLLLELQPRDLLIQYNYTTGCPEKIIPLLIEFLA